MFFPEGKRMSPGRRCLHILFLFTAMLVVVPSAIAGDSGAAYPPASGVKAAFLKQLDRPKVPLDAMTVSTQTEAGQRVVENVSIASERKADGTIERVPLLIVRP